MTKIPAKVRSEIARDQRYKYCMLKGHHGHICGGRITWEHALIYAGRQVQEKWAIISVCAAGQEVDEYQDAHTMNKEMNQWVAFNLATPADLNRYPRAPWLFEKKRLNDIYGTWHMPIKPGTEGSGIDYSLIRGGKELITD